MGLQSTQSESKKFVTIVGGKFRMKVQEGTDGAIIRKYELRDGTKGEKHEMVYDLLEGTIENIEFKDGEYGKAMEVSIDGVCVSIGVSSSYFKSLAERIPNIAFKELVTLKPYDFESDGKKMTGVSVQQKGEKLKSAFYDFDKKKSMLGMPQPDAKKVDEMGKDYWKIYFIEVGAFLVKYITDMKKDYATIAESFEKEVSKPVEKAEDLPF